MTTNKQPEEKETGRHCPYCDHELLAATLPYCRPCGVEVFYCPECRKPVQRDNRTCPHCGAEIKG